MQLFSKNIKYTNTEKDVIHYIEHHINDIDNLTITDLAKESHTSNATIIRLSHTSESQGQLQWLQRSKGQNYQRTRKQSLS